MIAETNFTVEGFSKRIQRLPDEQLIRYGKAARYMADPPEAVRHSHTILDGGGNGKRLGMSGVATRPTSSASI